MSQTYGPISLDRMVQAVELVRQRLMRATAALEAAGVPYAVAGGNAVASWVSRVDRAAVRTTQYVDLLINRIDLEVARKALEAAGFVYRHVKSIDMFLDGPGAKARDAVHILFAAEKVRAEYETAAPALNESEPGPPFRVLSLDALVRMKLTSFRDKDRVHVRDLVDVGLVDQSWTERLPSALANRLQLLLDTPDG